MECGAYAGGGFAPPLGAQVERTLFWNTRIALCPGGGAPSPGNIVGQDPQFFDASRYFFGPGSPAHDAGPPEEKSNDVDGTRNDLGAYGGPLGEVHLEQGAVLSSPRPLPGLLAAATLVLLCMWRRSRNRGRGPIRHAREGGHPRAQRQAWGPMGASLAVHSLAAGPLDSRLCAGMTMRWIRRRHCASHNIRLRGIDESRWPHELRLSNTPLIVVGTWDARGNGTGMRAEPTQRAVVGWRPGAGSLFVVLVILVLAVEVSVVHTREFLLIPRLGALAVTFDLTIGIPALYYLLIVRRRVVPAITIVPVLLLSILAAAAILPQGHQQYLEPWKQGLPLIELGVLAYVLSRSRSVVREVRDALRETPYLNEAMEMSAHRILGHIPGASFLVAELTAMVYAICGWFCGFRPRPGMSAFWYHHESGYGAVLLVLGVVVLPPEMLIAHLFISQWSSLVAWIWTGLELYGVLWLLGDYQAMRLNPIVLDAERLRLRIGLRWRVDLSLHDIVAVDAPGDGVDVFRMTVSGDPTTVLVLRNPVAVTRPLRAAP